MNIFYIFNTENEAIAADQQITQNVKNWVEQNSPDAITSDGLLRGRNAESGQFENAFTERWAIPQQRQDGKWAFKKPTQDRIGPIPLSIFTANVTASKEDEYDSSWFDN